MDRHITPPQSVKQNQHCWVLAQEHRIQRVVKSFNTVCCLRQTLRNMLEVPLDRWEPWFPDSVDKFPVPDIRRLEIKKVTDE